MLRYVYVAYLVHFKFHCLRVLKVCKSCVVYKGLCELGGFIYVFVSTSLFCNVLAMDRQPYVSEVKICLVSRLHDRTHMNSL